MRQRDRRRELVCPGRATGVSRAPINRRMHLGGTELMKRILKTALAATALLAVASATSAAFAKDTIVWWDFLGGGDGVRMKALIDQFNKEHADSVEIQATTLDWGTPFYTKVQT
jgi:ABC-type glycerol-3-phosphate transport system substrate-binding protein